jgi:hypothetical protein
VRPDPTPPDGTIGESKMDFHGLPFGLPRGFDFGRIRTIDDADTLICTLPNRDRGHGAHGLYRARNKIGSSIAFAGMMAAYEHDHRETFAAFGSDIKFANALRRVAPHHNQTVPIRAWRGIIVRDSDPREAAAGISWTTDRDVAAWFAMRYHKDIDGARPFVFTAEFDPDAVVAFYDDRHEAEVIVDLRGFRLRPVFVDFDESALKSLNAMAAPSDPAFASWQEASVRHEAVSEQH